MSPPCTGDAGFHKIKPLKLSQNEAPRRKFHQRLGTIHPDFTSAQQVIISGRRVGDEGGGGDV